MLQSAISSETWGGIAPLYDNDHYPDINLHIGRFKPFLFSLRVFLLSDQTRGNFFFEIARCSPIRALGNRNRIVEK